MEAVAEKLENEIEDENYAEQLQEFLKHPLNLNAARSVDLKEFPFLNDLQIENLLAYRKLFGNLLNIYELQAIPLWDIPTIRKILPYITVADPQPLISQLKKRISRGEQYLLLRNAQILEKSKGYEGIERKYPGSPQKILFRYQFHYKNLLWWGITAEKDAGEQFFRGRQKTGFDFYSFHLYASDLGKINSIAIGDFTVNLGQGLIQWQSFAFKKSSEVISIKRREQVIHPYNSAGEFYFSRGAAISLNQRHSSMTVFASRRKLSANLGVDSTAQENFVTSFLSSGYNRTETELNDKNNLRQLSYGGNINFHQKFWQAGLNFVGYQFSLPVNKKADAYNFYSLNGKTWTNISVDCSFSYRAIHFFGEAAADKKLDGALLMGAMLSPDPKIDLSMLGRFISKKYQAVYGNAFTENNTPSNENGFYTGLRIRPCTGWQLDFYFDIYQFPWLKFETDAPSRGKDFLVQAIYQPKKDLEITARFKSESKEVNDVKNGLATNFLLPSSKQNLRVNINYNLTRSIAIRNRLEILWIQPEEERENGFLGFFDLSWKRGLRNFSTNLRLQYFETTGYASRIYAYENDVLYSSSIPSFSDQGWRYYLNLHYDWGKNFSGWFRWSQSIYPGKTKIGSSFDEINGNKKTEIKFQGIWNF